MLITDQPIEPFVWTPWQAPEPPSSLASPNGKAARKPDAKAAAGTSPGAAANGAAAAADEAPAPPPPPPVPDFEALRQEHQARLATLEREAFTKGYAQGERAGMEAGAKRAEAMLRRVAHTVEELGALRQTLAQQSERQMVQLALMLARRIVHREVSLDQDLVAAMAHVALKKLGTTSPATIRLNPDDYTIVARESGRWSGAQVTIVPDPAVARGGCLVESEFGRIDATIDRQFDEMARTLLGDEPSTGGFTGDASSAPPAADLGR